MRVSWVLPLFLLAVGGNVGGEFLALGGFLLEARSDGGVLGVHEASLGFGLEGHWELSAEAGDEGGGGVDWAAGEGGGVLVELGGGGKGEGLGVDRDAGEVTGAEQGLPQAGALVDGGVGGGAEQGAVGEGIEVGGIDGGEEVGVVGL